MGIKNQIYEKGNRAGALSEALCLHNCRKPKIRALVEHVLGSWRTDESDFYTNHRHERGEVRSKALIFIKKTR